MQTSTILSPVGFLRLTAQEAALTRIEFLGPQADALPPTDALLIEVARQIALWFDDPAFCFDVPTQVQGTAFQRRVWAQIAAIPCGEVRTYAAVAQAISSAPRAVGGACGANPLPLVVPCHRVVAAHSLGGFNRGAGGVDWLPIKRWLLAHEQNHC